MLKFKSKSLAMGFGLVVAPAVFLSQSNTAYGVDGHAAAGNGGSLVWAWGDADWGGSNPYGFDHIGAFVYIDTDIEEVDPWYEADDEDDVYINESLTKSSWGESCAVTFAWKSGWVYPQTLPGATPADSYNGGYGPCMSLLGSG